MVHFISLLGLEHLTVHYLLDIQLQHEPRAACGTSGSLAVNQVTACLSHRKQSCIVLTGWKETVTDNQLKTPARCMYHVCTLQLPSVQCARIMYVASNSSDAATSRRKHGVWLRHADLAKGSCGGLWGSVPAVVAPTARDIGVLLFLLSSLPGICRR